MRSRESKGQGEAFERLVNQPDARVQELMDDGVFPNSRLPLLFYRNAVRLPDAEPAEAFEGLFRAHDWGGCWRNGIYTYHHYHSTAHEALGVYRGSAKVQLGGERGVTFEVAAGDVLIIPAGVAHKNLGARAGFGVVGAYPKGQDWDMNYGGADERPRADESIARVALPKMDPVYGTGGLLLEKWRAR